MAPTHLEKLILELLSMQRSVVFGVQWPVSLWPSTVLAVSNFIGAQWLVSVWPSNVLAASNFLTLGELGGLGRHLWATAATTCLSKSLFLSVSSSIEAQTRSLHNLWGYSGKTDSLNYLLYKTEENIKDISPGQGGISSWKESTSTSTTVSLEMVKLLFEAINPAKNVVFQLA